MTDIGTHILDVARMLFGEATQLVCQTRQMRDDIAGEDVATVLMRMESGVSVTCNMSYASRWELDRFPQTMIAIEGTEAGVSLGVDYEIKIVDSAGVQSECIPIPKYVWAEPAYGLIHASIVDCQRNLLDHLRGVSVAETTANDNLRTLQLVFAAYESHKNSAVMKIDPQDSGSFLESSQPGIAPSFH